MAQIFEIKNNDLTIGISTKGAEMQYVNGKGGTEFLWYGDESVWGGRAPVMFPICGGLKDDKFTLDGKEYTLIKHGFGRLSDFEAQKISDTEIKFTNRATDETKVSYPFDYVLSITYKITDNKLTVKYDVTNEGENVMYFSIGSHEAYNTPEGIEEYYVEFDTPQTLKALKLEGNLLGYDYDVIIDNQTRVDLKKEYFAIDALVFGDIEFDKATLCKKNSTKKITVEFPGKKNFLFWTKPVGKYICLEPWCNLPDRTDSDGDITHKAGMKKLEKGETFTIEHYITFEE